MVYVTTLLSLSEAVKIVDYYGSSITGMSILEHDLVEITMAVSARFCDLVDMHEEEEPWIDECEMLSYLERFGRRLDKQLDLEQGG